MKHKVYFYRLATFCLGCMFLLSGFAKGIDLNQFTIQILSLGIIDNPYLSLILARLVIITESVLGTALVINFFLDKSLWMSGIIMIFFTGISLWAWLGGDVNDCGCFGRVIPRSSGQAAIENLIIICIIGISLYVRPKIKSGSNHFKLGLIVLSFFVSTMLPFYFDIGTSKANGNNGDYNTFKLELNSIKGVTYVQSKNGIELIVLMDTGCSHCIEDVELLNYYSEHPDFPKILALCVNSKEEVDEFIKIYDPIFQIGRIDNDAFYHMISINPVPLYLLVKNRRIVGRWNMKLPEEDEFLSIISQY